MSRTPRNLSPCAPSKARNSLMGLLLFSALSSSQAMEVQLNCPSTSRSFIISGEIDFEASGAVVVNATDAGDCNSQFAAIGALNNGQRELIVKCPNGRESKLYIEDRVATPPVSASPKLLSITKSDEAGELVFEAYPVSDNACEPVVGDVSVTNFSVNSVPSRGVTYYDSRDQDSLVLRWNSSNAVRCKLVGNLPAGWSALTDLPPQSSGMTLPLSDLERNSALSIGIQCENGNTRSGISSVSVCPSTRRLPREWRRRFACVNAGNGAGTRCEFYKDVFNGDWAVASGKTRNIVMSKNASKEFVALQFEISEDQINRFGGWQTRGAIQVGFGEVNADVIVSVSHCPGDFDRAALEADGGCYYADGDRTTAPFWAAPNGILPRGNCRLAVGQNYFWNIIHSDSPSGEAPERLEVAEGCQFKLQYNPEIGEWENVSHGSGCGAQWTPVTGP